MQTIFICLWRLGEVNRELAQSMDTLDHCYALRDRAIAAKAKQSLDKVQSLMSTIKNAISKPCCASVLVAQVARVVRAFLTESHDVDVKLYSGITKQADVREQS